MAFATSACRFQSEIAMILFSSESLGGMTRIVSIRLYDRYEMWWDDAASGSRP